MSTQILEALVSRSSLGPRVQPAQGCTGKYIGSISLMYHCWVATGCVRDLFYSELKQKILRHLDGWSASVSSEDWVILCLYMIGRSERTASPTVCFISKNDRYRKEARNVIKESDILKKYPQFKTAHMSKDPEWGDQLEQLAPGQSIGTSGRHRGSANHVFYDRSLSLQLVGMPIYVRGASSMRVATANAIRLQGRLFYLAPCHAFIDGLPEAKSPSPEAEDDFEIDSDNETTYYDSRGASMTSVGTHSSGYYSDDADGSDHDDEHMASEKLLYSSPSIPTLYTFGFDGARVDSMAVEQEEHQIFPSATGTKIRDFAYLVSHPRAFGHCNPESKAAIHDFHLASLGVLFGWSVDQDWAIIEVVENEDLSLQSVVSMTLPDISIAHISLSPEDEAMIITYTASHGRMTGTISGTPSYIRVPWGSKFQQVHSVRLQGTLAQGDCGSAVFEAITGKLVGHIVAGCRATGFAYVMAARWVLPELEEAVRHPTVVPEPFCHAGTPPPLSPVLLERFILQKAELTPRQAFRKSKLPELANEKRQNTAENSGVLGMTGFDDTQSITSFGFIAADAIKIVERSTRVKTALEDLNTGMMAVVRPLLPEIFEFHESLVTLRILIDEYARPLPFLNLEFGYLLLQCEKIITSVKKEFPQQGTSVKEVAHATKRWGDEVEVTRQQLIDHKPAIKMCLSFMQLQLHLEAVKQTQRLLDTAQSWLKSLDNLRFRKPMLFRSRPFIVAPPQQSAADELHDGWRIFSQWLSLEDERMASTLARPDSFGEEEGNRNPGSMAAAIIYHLRREIEDAITTDEGRSKNIAADLAAPTSELKQNIGTLPLAPHRSYMRESDYLDADSKPGSHRLSLLQRSDDPTQSAFGFGGWSGLTPPFEPQTPLRRLNASSAHSSASMYPESQLSVSKLGVSTLSAGQITSCKPAVENAFTGRPSRLTLAGNQINWREREGFTGPLRSTLSNALLATLYLGEGSLDWNKLCRRVQVERVKPQLVQNKFTRPIFESRECDLHWRYREDAGISIRSVYRSRKDRKPRAFIVQDFPATGPSIPLSTSNPQGNVSIEFPKQSFGSLSKGFKNVKYTFDDTESSKRLQTLLYTNDNYDGAELLYDRSILIIKSNFNKVECRGGNVRLWRRHNSLREGHSECLVLLFYTSALAEENAHWVEEPHYAFTPLASSPQLKSSDKLKLVFRKEQDMRTSNMLFGRQKLRRSLRHANSSLKLKDPVSSKKPPQIQGKSTDRGDSYSSATTSPPTSKPIEPLRSIYSGETTASLEVLNRFGYSDLEIKFQNRKDRDAFQSIWQQYASLGYSDNLIS